LPNLNPDCLFKSDVFGVKRSEVEFCLELELNQFGVDPYSSSYLHLSVNDFNDEESVEVRFRVWMETSEGEKLTPDKGIFY
jgi:hypothetical protein